MGSLESVEKACRRRDEVAGADEYNGGDRRRCAVAREREGIEAKERKEEEAL